MGLDKVISNLEKDMFVTEKVPVLECGPMLAGSIRACIEMYV